MYTTPFRKDFPRKEGPLLIIRKDLIRGNYWVAKYREFVPIKAPAKHYYSILYFLINVFLYGRGWINYSNSIQSIINEFLAIQQALHTKWWYFKTKFSLSRRFTLLSVNSPLPCSQQTQRPVWRRSQPCSPSYSSRLDYTSFALLFRSVNKQIFIKQYHGFLFWCCSHLRLKKLCKKGQSWSSLNKMWPLIDVLLHLITIGWVNLCGGVHIAQTSTDFLQPVLFG